MLATQNQLNKKALTLFPSQLDRFKLNVKMEYPPVEEVQWCASQPGPSPFSVVTNYVTEIKVVKRSVPSHQTLFLLQRPQDRAGKALIMLRLCKQARERQYRIGSKSKADCSGKILRRLRDNDAVHSVSVTE